MKLHQKASFGTNTCIFKAKSYIYHPALSNSLITECYSGQSQYVPSKLSGFRWYFQSMCTNRHGCHLPNLANMFMSMVFIRLTWSCRIVGLVGGSPCYFLFIIRLLLRWVLVHGVLAWGPYGPMWAHVGLCGPIWAHMGPCGPIRAHTGPTLKHHVLKPTLAAAELFSQSFELSCIHLLRILPVDLSYTKSQSQSFILDD